MVSREKTAFNAMQWPTSLKRLSGHVMDPFLVFSNGCGNCKLGLSSVTVVLAWDPVCMWEAPC